MLSQPQREVNPIRRCRLPFRGVSLALIATALVAFCGVSLIAQEPNTALNQNTRHHRVFPDTTNGIFPFSDEINMTPLTAAQVKFFATHYVGGQKQTTAEAAELRKYNANFLIMHYRLGEMLGYGSCDANGNPTGNNLLQIIDTNWVNEWPGDSVVQPNSFYYYNGSKVYACDAQHYLMNISDPGWRAFYSQQVIKELTDNDDDAVFADSYSVPDEWQDWTPELDYATWIGSGPPNLETKWSGMIHDFTNYMRSQLNGRWLWIPNVGSWVTSRDITDYTNVDGAMIEDFADYGNANFLATSDWQLQMDRALSLVNLDKILIAQTYPAPYGNSTYALPERLFITGSFLLIKGRHTYLNLDATGQTLEWWPEYAIDLGAPIDPLPSNNDITKFWNAKWGVYVRHYANGMVLVNSTNASDGIAPTPITLDKTYYEVVGDVNSSADVPVPPNGIPTNTLTYQAVKGLTVCNDCAAILLNHPPQQ